MICIFFRCCTHYRTTPHVIHCSISPPPLLTRPTQARSLAVSLFLDLGHILLLCFVPHQASARSIQKSSLVPVPCVHQISPPCAALACARWLAGRTAEVKQRAKREPRGAAGEACVLLCVCPLLVLSRRTCGPMSHVSYGHVFLCAHHVCMYVHV